MLNAVFLQQGPTFHPLSVQGRKGPDLMAHVHVGHGFKSTAGLVQRSEMVWTWEASLRYMGSPGARRAAPCTHPNADHNG